MSTPAPVTEYVDPVYDALPVSCGLPISADDHPDGSDWAAAGMGVSHRDNASSPMMTRADREYVLRTVQVKTVPLLLR